MLVARNGNNGTQDGIFTLPELAEMSEIDYRTLHNWQKRGMLRPSHVEANGSGTVSLFSETDAIQVLILAELRRAGVEVRILERIASKVREVAASPGEEDLLLIAEDAVLLRDIGELGQQLSREEPNVVLSISNARDTVGQARAA
jgi:DNA-binding transcriptional MerR regulator